ncbi:MAG: hypothetical protein LAO79_14100 [Acidobacteriia bacterium]|nr:hypothetical protein [Terriglobia bacterium]
MRALLLLLCASAFASAQESRCAREVPKPIYPPLARQARLSGAVEARIVVGRDGRVTTAAYSGTTPIFIPANQFAIASHKFSTACAGSEFVVLYRFRLDGNLPLRALRVEFKPPNQWLVTAGPEPVNPMITSTEK